MGGDYANNPFQRSMKISITVSIFGVFCLLGFTTLPARAGQVDSVAPAPVMLKLQGAGEYQYLSKLYYEGEEKPRQPRSVVVLNFMGLNCAPCRKELPLFLEVLRPLAEKSKESDQKVRFFLVSTDKLSSKKDLRIFLADYDVDPDKVLLDPYQTAAKMFGVTGIPRTIVISPQGRIAAEITGAVDGYKEKLRKGIRKALSDKGGK